ncbi:uncharacterized protein LOC141601952 [Silene latifolia]|uniref:uncharacterized protein LOC141601952 n=1 Tax=Silene latifolia TaxID=37657 RepID=UPI003D788BDF
MTTSATNTEASYVNPYDEPTFLANSDSTSMELGNLKFSGKNFLSWSKCVVMALGTKNKEGFLTGVVPMPALMSQKYQQWQRSDNMSNAPLLFQLKKELRNMTQGNDSVVEYFTKLKRYWDDIDELEVIPEYSCGAMAACTCNLYKKMLDLAVREKVLYFLMGLSDAYEHPRSNILAMEPLPPLNRVYSIIQQIESQKIISSIFNNSQDVSAMNAAKSGGKTPWNVWRREDKKPKADDNRWCYHCNKKGHLSEDCFVKFPELKAKYFTRFSGNVVNGPAYGQQTNSSSSQYVPQYVQGTNSHSQQGFVTAAQHQQGAMQAGACWVHIPLLDSSNGDFN